MKSSNEYKNMLNIKNIQRNNNYNDYFDQIKKENDYMLQLNNYKNGSLNI